MGWPHGRPPKGKILKLRSADSWKLHFSLIFLELQSFMGSLEEKLARKMHSTFLYLFL